MSDGQRGGNRPVRIFRPLDVATLIFVELRCSLFPMQNYDPEKKYDSYTTHDYLAKH